MHKVIRRSTGFPRVDFAELWAYRELLGFLAWRDITVRYKQTAIGAGWAFLRPFIQMIILTFVFGRLAKLPSEGVPYSLLTFSALVPWMFFATGFVEIANVIVGTAHMVQKIYFPRLVLPVAASAVATIDFLVSFGCLLVMMLFFGIFPTVKILALPLFFLICLVFTLGMGIWFATLFVKYRDVRHFLPFIVQLGLYLSPVAFLSRIVPERWRLLYALNPMVAVIDGFRWALLGLTPPDPRAVALGAAMAVLLLITGIVYFAYTERKFADLL